jgi:hypothetical protein
MDNDRLSDLILMAVKGFLALKINLDEATDLFSKMKNKNVPFIYRNI